MATEGVPAGTRFVWDQAERRLEADMRRADSLDTKAGVLVGLHALAAGVIATSAGRFHGAARWVVVSAILGLLVSGGLALGAFGTQRDDRSPTPEEAWTYGEWDQDEIRLRLLSTRFDAIEVNRAILDRKARRVASSLVVLAVVALMTAVSTVIGIVRVG
jgi:hypothetical protein